MSSSTISGIVRNDHITVNELYKNYIMSQGDIKEQERLSIQFQQELTKHSTAEETVLYPAFEQYLGPEGKQIADQGRNEHETIKKLLHSLGTTPVSNPQHRIIFSELMTNLNEHIRSEEKNDLSKFESAITADISASLAQAFGQAKLSVVVKYVILSFLFYLFIVFM
ncbi:unnamed protein product [Rotaria sordida]|uniref:Hemerythrin-like domain-containing protein n=1 Tax=Rotaria sordida TaxID=392033 RepID=A0A819JSW1_9BILA|nr:unnamed protein product [Rotaria sordida]CAF1080448.1 unnamed protein product [Rotaria sordida]CAF1140286.1 unnamed protein product [Rotaria sordida]CAF3794509.1 unnamed protein product [Rotaria sordida]CAF3937844.1 unnamed protein product [Rotaria sordida]